MKTILSFRPPLLAPNNWFKLIMSPLVLRKETLNFGVTVWVRVNQVRVSPKIQTAFLWYVPVFMSRLRTYYSSSLFHFQTIYSCFFGASRSSNHMLGCVDGARGCRRICLNIMLPLKLQARFLVQIHENMGSKAHWLSCSVLSHQVSSPGRWRHQCTCLRSNLKHVIV